MSYICQRPNRAKKKVLTCEPLESRQLMTADLTSVVAHFEDEGIHAFVVNGAPTDDFPSVGIVNDRCTGTLISERHVLTAAHCTEGVGQRGGSFEVNGQRFATTAIFDHHLFEMPFWYVGYDISVMELVHPVEGVTPSLILREGPAVGEMLTLVGFGETGTSTDGSNFDFGDKQVGTTTLEVVSPLHLEWWLDHHLESSTAFGDSGGPAFVDIDGNRYIAGVTSGGSFDPFALGAHSIDTRVDVYADWIDAVVSGATEPSLEVVDDHADQPDEIGFVSTLIVEDQEDYVEHRKVVVSDVVRVDRRGRLTLDESDVLLRAAEHRGSWVVGQQEKGEVLLLESATGIATERISVGLLHGGEGHMTIEGFAYTPQVNVGWDGAGIVDVIRGGELVTTEITIGRGEGHGTLLVDGEDSRVVSRVLYVKSGTLRLRGGAVNVFESLDFGNSVLIYTNGLISAREATLGGELRMIRPIPAPEIGERIEQMLIEADSVLRNFTTVTLNGRTFQMGMDGNHHLVGSDGLFHSVVVRNDGVALVTERRSDNLLVSGDATGDGHVGFEDFLVLASNFGNEVPNWEDGDFDGNALVDFADFLVLSNQFGHRSLEAPCPTHGQHFENNTSEVVEEVFHLPQGWMSRPCI